MKKVYISFCGEFQVPSNCEELKAKHPKTFGFEEVLVRNRYNEIDDDGRQVEIDDDFYRKERYENEYREGLDYEYIDGKDSLSVYLAVIDNNVGHLVADCTAGGWVSSTFVVLEDGKPKRPVSNFNPNPVRQLV
jgi:hypothetical protein